VQTDKQQKLRASFTCSTGIFLLLLVGGTVGCRPDLYVLPTPPPASEWERVELDPTVEDRRAGERYVEARRAVLAFVDALSQAEWEQAYRRVSNETRLLLDAGFDGQGEASLAEGRTRRDRRLYSYDPMDLFLIQGLTRIEDSVEGEAEAETQRRHEVFVFDAEGQYRKVVLIREGDEWLIHLPRWPQERLTPEPGS
jgi:hypothetical protein